MDPITLTIAAVALQAHVSPELLMAVCWVETRHRNVVTVRDGKDSSMGVCQVKPQTARFMARRKGITFYSSELLNVEKNAQYAALYLEYQLKRYKGNIWAAVDAYNKGSAKRCNTESKNIRKKTRLRFDSCDTYIETKYRQQVKKALRDKPWKAN
jgi:soluble lytic murein transglycosylase-like protein